VLIQLRVENHRSLREEQTLSLVAASAGDKDDACLIRSKGLSEALLPVVALYGANASGKSNVISALAFMKTAVQKSHRLWDPNGGTPREPFALSKKAEEPSLFEVDFLFQNVRYRYGFVIGSEKIEEEWLFAWPRGKKQTWFEREGTKLQFGKHLRGENETIRALTRGNSLFLSAAAQNNHAMLLPVAEWFSNLVVRGSPSNLIYLADFAAAMLSLVRKWPRADQRDSYFRAVLNLLQAADTGIVDFRLDEVKLSAQYGWSGSTAPSIELWFRHKTEDEKRAWLPLAAESQGTVMLLHLATEVTVALMTGGVLCVDELDASLHPMIALELLRLFHDPQRNPHGSQLVFTTHDTNLLGSLSGEPLLRRDQIWFTEKDQAGATKLYPLTDFHPRKEENLERGYLQGRYGAIPFLGELLPPGPAERDA
jgi:predicted ATPase